MRIAHPYLMTPGIWHARGRYRDDQDRAVAAEGSAELRHHADVWELVGELRLLGPRPVAFTNRYRIAPAPAEARLLRWQSDNPALGRLEGVFVLVDDTILVRGASADQHYRVVETLTLIDERQYCNRGALIGGDARLGAWAMELTRAGTPGTC
jgi:hypothetical protein